MPTPDHRCRETETGASSVEYGLLAAAVAGVLVAVVLATGAVTEETYGDTCDSIALHSEISMSCS